MNFDFVNGLLRIKGLRAALGAMMVAAAGLAFFAGCSSDDPPLNLAVVPAARPAFNGPTQSGSLALSANGAVLVVANPDVDTVSVFDVSTDTPAKRSEIPVGDEPRAVAVTPDGLRAFVANAAAGTVSIIAIDQARVTGTIEVGAEPVAVALSPNGLLAYVANSVSNTVTVIDAFTERVIRTVSLPVSVGYQPSRIAVTNDGDTDDIDEKVMVAFFFASLRPGKTGLDEGQDDAKEGRVAILNASDGSLVRTVALAPLAVTGFNANGSVLDFINTVDGINGVAAPDPTNPIVFNNPTGAWPNQLSAVAIRPGTDLAYVVSTGTSPNGPVRFDVNVQGLVSVFNTSTGVEVTGDAAGAVFQSAPLNLNRGIDNSTNAPRLFHSNPVAMAWRPNGADAWVVIQQADLLVRLTVNAAGLPTINAPTAAGGGAVTRVDLQTPGGAFLPGKAPRGIVINAAGTRAYVDNFVTRSISVVNLDAAAVVGTAQSTALPPAGSLAATVQQGAEFFFTGRGPQGRLSSNGWGACIACHPDGRTDTVTWMFPVGPRQTIHLDSTFAPQDKTDQRVLNYTADRDENQDFELNTRGVSGGRGLIEDSRLTYVAGGQEAAADSAVIQEINEFTSTIGNTNGLSGAALPALPSARRDFATATLPDGRVYFLGGRSGAAPGTILTADAVVEYDPSTNTVRSRSMTGFTARHSLGAAAVNTAFGPRIYTFGGYDTNNPATAPVTVVQEYNPVADTWRTVAPLPVALAEMGVANTFALNTAHPQPQIHILGGNIADQNAPDAVGTAHRFNVPTDPAGLGTFTTLGVTLTPRRLLGGAALTRAVTPFIFAVGGIDDAGTALATVESYNANNPVALTATITQLPAPRAGFGVGIANNLLFVSGGENPTGTPLNTILRFNPALNGAVAGPPGTPSGVWVTLGATLSTARSRFGGSFPRPVNNFLPNASSNRDTRQDAINEWIKFAVRVTRAPNHNATGEIAAAVGRGRTLFGSVGLTATGVSCATCHGGPKWSRSRVDYTPPPSASQASGAQEIVGGSIVRTATQPNTAPQNGVLTNVGTFNAARNNEVQPAGADAGQRVSAAGAAGFNISSLLSVSSTAPYFHNGAATTLEDVLNGTRDGNGTSTLNRVHFIPDTAQRADMIQFLNSIDTSTPIFP